MRPHAKRRRPTGHTGTLELRCKLHKQRSEPHQATLSRAGRRRTSQSHTGPVVNSLEVRQQDSKAMPKSDDTITVELYAPRSGLFRLDVLPFVFAYAVLHASAWARLRKTGEPPYGELK